MRPASDHEIAAWQLPSCQSWNAGPYAITIQPKGAHDSFAADRPPIERNKTTQCRHDDHTRTTGRTFRYPRCGCKTVRAVPRRVLAPARSRDGLSFRFRRCADRGRLSFGADPRGIWRGWLETLGRGRDPPRDPARGLQRPRLPRPEVHHGYVAAAWQRGAKGEMAAQDRQRRVAPAGVR